MDWGLEVYNFDTGCSLKTIVVLAGQTDFLIELLSASLLKFITVASEEEGILGTGFTFTGWVD